MSELHAWQLRVVGAPIVAKGGLEARLQLQPAHVLALVVRRRLEVKPDARGERVPSKNIRKGSRSPVQHSKVH